MKRIARSRADKLGLPPGTLVHVGEAKEEAVELSVIDYTRDRIEEKRLESPDDIRPYLGKETVTWFNVSGVHEVESVGAVGEILGVHPLVLEDVVNTHQRPKAEAYENHLFLVLKMIRYDAETSELDLEQVSLVLGSNYVVTFQEKPGDVFDPVRERIRQGKGRLRKSGSDYLAYTLLDVVVDHYFLALEGLGGEIEDLEEELVSNPGPRTLQQIHSLKQVMVAVRKAVWPLRELIASLERSESNLITPFTQPYLRDVYDHSIQVIDTVETYRDVLSGYLDMYLSSVSNRMNEVMKVLTIMATLFIPLTFVAGIYGMNFEHMPELKWRWGYLAVWVLMAGVVVSMIAFFKRKRWL